LKNILKKWRKYRTDPAFELKIAFRIFVARGVYSSPQDNRRDSRRFLREERRNVKTLEKGRYATKLDKENGEKERKRETHVNR